MKLEKLMKLGEAEKPQLRPMLSMKQVLKIVPVSRSNSGAYDQRRPLSEVASPVGWPGRVVRGRDHCLAGEPR